VETTLRYQLPKQAEVRLEIYNGVGERVKSLVNATHPGGYHTVRWDGQDDSRRAVSSGVYLYRLRAGQLAQRRKMALIR